MRILALDLGTATGFAYDDPYEGLTCGAWKLASAKEIATWGKDRSTRRCDPRIKRLFDYVNNLHTLHFFDVICIEDVQFASSTYQVQLWAGLRSAAWLAGQNNLKKWPYFEAVPVGTLKKHATGNGSADKAQMLSAARRHKLLDPITELDELTDDAIDALWLYNWAQKNLSRMKII